MGRGRISVFGGPRSEAMRVQGWVMTLSGKLAFERARVRLGRLYEQITGRKLASVSDGNTIEFLARGEQQTREYLEREAGK